MLVNEAKVVSAIRSMNRNVEKIMNSGCCVVHPKITKVEIHINNENDRVYANCNLRVTAAGYSEDTENGRRAE